jgi:putative DNA methylase
MGSGTTIGEALKLGCKVIGADINPVSAFQVRKALEPVDIDELKEAFIHIEDKVKSQIQALYQSLDPDTGTPADILYSFWVMAVCCPACKRNIDLFDTSIFAKNAYPKEVPIAQSVCFKCGSINTTRYDTTYLTCDECNTSYNPQAGVVHRDRAVCPFCQLCFKIVQAVTTSKQIPSYRMYALLILNHQGTKKYIRPTKEDQGKYEHARELLLKNDMVLPTTTIETGHNTNQIIRYNYREWRQLFNYRQQYCLSLLLQTILEESNTACRELLLLLFSGTLEFNNMLCSYKGEGTGAVRPIFNHHILKPGRMVLENSVWGTTKSSGCFSTLFDSRLIPALAYRQEPFEINAIQEKGKYTGKKVFGLSSTTTTPLATTFDELDENHRALLFCTSSSHLNLPDASVDVVVTDPPYFDFVHYSELADFFYAWLKPGLQDTYPEFLPRTTRHLEEVQQKDANAFSRALLNVLYECNRVLKPEGLLIFSFHHSRNEGWEAVGQAIFDAGLGVVAAHPIKAEMAAASPKSQASNPINYDAILVCKHREPTTSITLTEAIQVTLQKVRDKLYIITQNSSSFIPATGDIFVILQSEALCVFSQHFGLMKDISNVTITLQDFLKATNSYLKTIGDHHPSETEEFDAERMIV